MHVTVAICTWNRCELLEQTLLGLERLRVPPGVEWELLVVNNNCTDDTAAVLDRHVRAGRLPIRPLLEPKQGHSNARNCAITAARGDLLLWTDDDVHVDPGWLEAYWEAAQAFPDATFFGGTIRPRYEVSPPPWVIDAAPLLSGPFAVLDYGPGTRTFTAAEVPFGANMAFRTSVLQAQHFDPSLGRVGNHLISGDDIVYCERLVRRGHLGIWVGNAIVHHHVPRSRMTRDYVIRWYEGAGASEARSDLQASGTLWFGAPRWMWRCALYYSFRQAKSLCLFRGWDLVASAQLARLRGARRELAVQEHGSKV